MRAPITSFTKALCVLALAVQLTACGDDDDEGSGAKTDDDSKSGVTAPDDTKSRDRDRDTASGGAPGGSVVLTETTCLAGASRFPQTSAECLGCVCETIAACGAACQELLVCALTNCVELLGDSVSVAACALKNCAVQANAPGAAIGLTEALGGIAACGPTCTPPPPPPLGEPDASTPDTSDDAGVADSTDAGLE